MHKHLSQKVSNFRDEIRIQARDDLAVVLRKGLMHTMTVQYLDTEMSPYRSAKQR